MKTINIMRGYAGLQAFFPSLSENVQEVAPMNKVSISANTETLDAARPRLLAQRNARLTHRQAH
ncbi:MAG: hypothetical protein ACX94B_10020 [Henriciella sp.]